MNTGNLAAPTSLVDARPLPGGSTNEPFSKVQDDYGNYVVTAVHIDVDGGEGGNQTVDFDNTTVNGKFVTYEPRHGISVLMQRTAGTIKVKAPGKENTRTSRRSRASWSTAWWTPVGARWR